MLFYYCHLSIEKNIFCYNIFLRWVHDSKEIDCLNKFYSYLCDNRNTISEDELTIALDLYIFIKIIFIIKIKLFLYHMLNMKNIRIYVKQMLMRLLPFIH